MNEGIFNLIYDFQLVFVLSEVILLAGISKKGGWFFGCGSTGHILFQFFRYAVLMEFVQVLVDGPFGPIDDVVGLLAEATKIFFSFKLLCRHHRG
jgi:hypothetical protein